VFWVLWVGNVLAVVVVAIAAGINLTLSPLPWVECIRCLRVRVSCSMFPAPCSCPSSFVLVQGCVRKFITGKGTWNTFAWKLPPPHSHIYFDWCAGTKSPRIKYGSSTLKRSLNYLPKHPEMLVIPTVWSGQGGKRVMFEDQWACPHLGT